MSWLTLTIFAQFLNSIVSLIDKYLVTSKKITTPLLYVFYTGILTSLGIIIYVPTLIFNSSSLPSLSNIAFLSIGAFLFLFLAACSQLVALWGLFTCLKCNDASDVVPVIGSLSAVCALIIGYIWLDVSLPIHFAIGFALLIVGTLFISHLRFSKKTFLLTVVSGLGFALYSILLKEVLIAYSFENSFFWLSVITPLVSLCLLFIPSMKISFSHNKKQKQVKRTGVILLLNKIIAGIAGILLIKALENGEVSLIQALGGLQFLFLFILGIVFGPLTSQNFGENIKRNDLYTKLIAISIIFVGFVVLFL